MEVIYFCGNSLGLQPKSVKKFLDVELEKWELQAVEGHFEEPHPWVSYHHLGRSQLADLVGAQVEEVVAMNTLTTNLHLLLASFYQPSADRSQIMIEDGSFPSDYYAITTHMIQKGVDPQKNLIELQYDEANPLTTERIIESIEQNSQQLSLVLLPGVQYYTGQFFDISRIAKTCQNHNIPFGLDLAHAMGNIPLSLHDDGVDFAVWCSYKYMNSGPGNVGGAYIHEKHGSNTSLPRLAGWWGQQEDIRFQMENDFKPASGVDGWMLSNVNVLSTAAHLASLEIFHEAGIHNLREKSIKLTGYLDFLLKDIGTQSVFRIITPSDPNFRGCQLSLFFDRRGKEIFDHFSKHNIIADWRVSNVSDPQKGVIRIAPTPLYNRFEEVYSFYEILKDVL